MCLSRAALHGHPVRPNLGMLMHTAWPVRILRGVLLCGIGNGDYGGGYGGGGGGKQQIQL